MLIRIKEQLKKILGPNAVGIVALTMMSIVGIRIMIIQFNTSIVNRIFEAMGVIVIICGIVIYRESTSQIRKY